MRRGRGRWVAIGTALAIVATALALVARPPGAPLPPGMPTASGSAAPGSAGPVVYYEVLDADAARLFARTLDGQSLPREVAARSDADGPAWAVDPGGSIAVAVTGDEAAGPGLIALDVRTGRQAWAIPMKDPLEIASVVWAPDGSRFAAFLDDPDAVVREIALVDVRAGAVRFPVIPDDAQLQGFAADGGLILRRAVVDEAALTTSWRFLRVDPVAIPIQELADLPSVGPAGNGYEAAAPAAGVAIDQTNGDGQPGISVRLWDLGRTTSRILATLPSIDRVAIDPGATGVVVTGSDGVRFVTLDGRSSDVFAADAPIADLGWSARGDFLLVTTDLPIAGLTVVERATGRSVAIPHAGPALSLRFVSMPGGVALPQEPLPAAEPTPTPTPGPSGPDVAGFPGVLAGWVAEASGRFVVHAQRLAPTEDGGLRVAAELPPIDVGAVAPDDPSPPNVLLLPRPRSSDVLVWITTTEGSLGVLWTSAGNADPVELPVDWPPNVGDIAWRPDGNALAGSSGRPVADGEFEPDFVVAAIGARRTTVVPVIGSYTRLEGWWSATELRVGDGACFEGCPGRFAESARLRVADRRLVQLTPADRASAAIDGLAIDGDQLVLSTIAGDPADDLRIDWPSSLTPGRLTLVGPFADTRDLVLARSIGASTELYRIRDVAARAIAGRLANPDPVRFAAIAGRDLQVELSPGREWALVTDRVGETRLVRLSDGRTWPVDTGRALAWAAG